MILGTAHFFRIYGINNNKKKISTNVTKNIINNFFKKGYRQIDTAPEYNNEINLSKILNKHKNKILDTKTLNLNTINKKNLDLCEKTFFNSLKIFDVNKFNNILVHNPKNLLNKDKNIFFKLLKSLKNQKLVNKIGVSIYNFEDIKKLNERFNIRLFQVPFNIFDQRLLNLEVHNFIKKKKIEIHARSIFLQGAMFMSIPKAKKKIKNKKFILKLNELDNLCAKNKVRKIDLIINYVQNYKFIKNKLIAPISLKQMNEIISFKHIDLSKFDLKYLNIKEKKLINPSFW